MPRTRADILVALHRTARARHIEADQLFDEQQPDDTRRTVARLDALDHHIDGLLDTLQEAP